MGFGTDLLELQEVDLSLMREQSKLDKMPEVAELARKRASYKKLKAEAAKLLGQRKDADIALEDLREEKHQVEASVTAVQQNAGASSDYQEVKRLEAELSSLAKRLDKIEFSSKSALERAESLRAKEAAALRYIERFEQSIRDDAVAVRQKASEQIETISNLKSTRDRLRSQIPGDTLEEYDRARKTFNGIAVETLEGNKPSVCRVSLQASSMADLKHEGEVTRCPYCHRILVRSIDEE